MMHSKMKSCVLKCLRCKSKFTLKGLWADRIAESGKCPVCHWQGMLTMESMTV